MGVRRAGVQLTPTPARSLRVLRGSGHSVEHSASSLINAPTSRRLASVPAQGDLQAPGQPVGGVSH